jgi:hypothetical protein
MRLVLVSGFCLLFIAPLTSGPPGPPGLFRSSDPWRFVNPQNRDYGAALARLRKAAVRASLASVQCWALLTSIIFLALASVVLIHQHGEKQRREIIVARLLAQYHNAWTEAKRKADDAITRYNALLATEDARRQTADDAQTNREDNAADDDKPVPTSSSATDLFLAGSYRPARNSHSRIDTNPAIKTAAPRHKRDGEVDLLAQVTTLQQQLNAACERERNLQRELSKRHLNQH